MVGVAGSRGTVRSTTRMPPLTIPAARSASSAEFFVMALYLSSDAELRTQLAQRFDEDVDVLVVVVEVKADAQVVITIGRDDAAPHQFLGQRAARSRRHADHGAASPVLLRRDARPADLLQLFHAATRQRTTAPFDRRHADIEHDLQSGFRGIATHD